MLDTEQGSHEPFVHRTAMYAVMNLSVTGRTNRADMSRMIRPAVCHPQCVVWFEVWGSVSPVKWSDLAARLTCPCSSFEDVRLYVGTAPMVAPPRIFRSNRRSLSSRVGSTPKLVETDAAASPPIIVAR